MAHQLLSQLQSKEIRNMTRLTMREKQLQIARLIRNYIRQLETALSADNWHEIQKINQDVNRLLRVVMPSAEYPSVLQRELQALHFCLEKVQKNGQQREKALAIKLEKFHDQKEGLRAYQEAQGWS